VVFLLDASSDIEQRLLTEWIRERHAPTGIPYDVIAIPPTRRRRRRKLNHRAQLEGALAAPDDPLLTPLRVAWLAAPESGSGSLRRLLKLLLIGDPRDPGRLRQSWVARAHPERVQVVLAEAAPVSELRARWRAAGGAGFAETTGLAEYVTRQAALALERAERRLRGLRYKVPRFVRSQILARPAFQGGVAQLAAQLGRSQADVMKEASKDLAEIAATHSPHVIDLTAGLIHVLYSRGYSAIHYDRADLARIYQLAQRHPVVFLPSHKSNLDHLALQYALHENGHPPNHTAGGINMNFFPVGPLVRRSGVFFIRRTFKDDAVYKFVLRHYVDYLIEKRFSLEWYIEGGRSRSGKLLPPRFGLLAYVVDAYRRGKSEDVHLIPVAIAYDQIQDVGAYTAEQRGGKKERESFGWFLGVVRGLRRRYGAIHIRFGEPVSLAQAMGPSNPDAEPDDDEQSLAIQKLAFEVSDRINRATPITPTSLVTLALLGGRDRAQSVAEVGVALKNLLHFVRGHDLPTTSDLELDTPEGIRRTLDTLRENGVVTCYSGGDEPVYRIGEGQYLTAAYYRNTIVHFFVNSAIAELALLRAAEDDVVERAGEFWAEAIRLRDLFKFEFFFADRERFRGQLYDEMAFHDPTWEAQLERGPAAIKELLRRVRPFNAHRVLLPFLEAYQVVGDALEREPAQVDEAKFLTRCMALGEQYRLQRRVRSAESVSKVLFETAIRLAKNRGLFDPKAPDLAARRMAFATEIRAAIRRAESIDLLAATRRAGLLE
jgi:glycerol-3-phosphate O-acyltransferase